MKHIVTLVSSTPELSLRPDHLLLVENCISSKALRVVWLAEEQAVDLFFNAEISEQDRIKLIASLATDKVDCFFTENNDARRKKLLIADMDNTMVVGETLDDLAEHCGLKDRVAAITEKAMRGELNFQAALRERVAMLRGLSESALQETADSIEIMPGAGKLVATMRSNGAMCVLVSGGFTCFTEPVASKLGFHKHHGNLLGVVGGKLTGEVGEPIIDFALKLQYLKKYAGECGLHLNQTLAVGDGANDLEMLRHAGLGVGFHPKPLLRQKVMNCVLHGDLTALLFAQGYVVD